MIRKEMRIAELMQDKDIDGCRDAAESVFGLDLEDMYPDEPDQDVREMIFETELEK